MGRGASREQGCAKGVDRKYRLDYDEQHLYLSHKVGRSLCMLMCAGLGLFLCAIGVITLVAESVYEPCDLEPAEGPRREPPPPPPPPPTEVGPLGTGSVGCAPLNATGAERGFVMYSAEAVGTRFAGYPDTGGAEHFACVAWVGGLEPGWRLQAGAQPSIGRSLAPSDVLVASFEPGFGPPTPGEGAREELGAAGGATFGYASGDLEISRDGNTTTFLVNGTALVAHPPPPPPAPPPPPPCHEVPPGGTHSLGWFLFGGLVLILSLFFGGCRGGCKYEEVEFAKHSQGVQVTVSRFAFQCIKSWKCCRLGSEKSHIDKPHAFTRDLEAQKVDYEEAGGVCAPAPRDGKTLVVSDGETLADGHASTRRLAKPVIKTLQIWNGQALSLSDAKQLETDINKFLQGEGWKGFEKARELTDWHGDEWKGTPRETGPGSPRKASRVRRDSMKRTSSFAPTQRQKRFSTAKLLEQQKAKEAAQLRNPKDLVEELQQARSIFLDLQRLQADSAKRGRPQTAELDMLVKNMEAELQQLEMKFYDAGESVPPWPTISQPPEPDMVLVEARPQPPRKTFDKMAGKGDGLVTRHDDDDYGEQEQPESEVREGAEETEAAQEDGCALLLATLARTDASDVSSC